jgi:tetratricopeptide (TPR) repeat protein
MRGPVFAIVVGLVGLAGACSSPAPPAPVVTIAPAAKLHPGAVLPAPSGPLAPAQAVVDGELAGITITETESCAGCHAQAAADWRSSPHAFASFNNPVYRVVVDAFRKDVGNEASRFCGGCHDVALLVDGAMSRDVAPDDPRAHGGVACRVCHGIESVRPDGNGSYTLATTPIPVPRDGDEASLREHKARMAMPPLRTAQLCGACHRSFLSPETGNPAHLVGQDELGAWQRSAYAGSLAARVDEEIEPAECRSCHMPLAAAPLGDAASKDGKLRSHRFAGGNTWLAAMRGDGAQVDAVRAMLRGAASLDIAAALADDGTRTLPADGAKVLPGQALTFDVVVRNERAGHKFPGGVLDAQDTWIEIEVRDARGRRLASAGAAQESTGDDPDAHVLHAALADDHGTPLMLRETQRFRAAVYDHTLAPRDAAIARFRFETPVDLAPAALPLRVTARLRHRSRDLALARAVCADGKTARGLAFAREVRGRTDVKLDACAPEPITEIAESVVFVGAGAPAASATMPEWRRLYDDGLGLLHAQQEAVDDARPSLERALALVGDDPRQRAIVLHAMAEMAIREGRTDEALQRLDEAAALAPSEPAIDHARAKALGGVWRWKEATAPLALAARAAPLDDTVWSHLAVAYGSADEPALALDAARHGLALSPRDADLLRVQALALERLGSAVDDVNRARDAFARWRPPDDAPAVKSACSRQSPTCALERLPVHVHVMTPDPVH